MDGKYNKADLLRALADTLETASKLARSLAAEYDAETLAAKVEEGIRRREMERRSADKAMHDTAPAGQQ